MGGKRQAIVVTGCGWRKRNVRRSVLFVFRAESPRLPTMTVAAPPLHGSSLTAFPSPSPILGNRLGSYAFLPDRTSQVDGAYRSGYNDQHRACVYKPDSPLSSWRLLAENEGP